MICYAFLVKEFLFWIAQAEWGLSAPLPLASEPLHLLLIVAPPPCLRPPQVPKEKWFEYGGERKGRFQGLTNQDGAGTIRTAASPNARCLPKPECVPTCNETAGGSSSALGGGCTSQDTPLSAQDLTRPSAAFTRWAQAAASYLLRQAPPHRRSRRLRRQRPRSCRHRRRPPLRLGHRRRKAALAAVACMFRMPPPRRGGGMVKPVEQGGEERVFLLRGADCSSVPLCSFGLCFLVAVTTLLLPKKCC